jgi:hypothetical protein
MKRLRCRNLTAVHCRTFLMPPHQSGPPRPVPGFTRASIRSTHGDRGSVQSCPPPCRLIRMFLEGAPGADPRPSSRSANSRHDLPPVICGTAGKTQARPFSDPIGDVWTSPVRLTRSSRAGRFPRSLTASAIIVCSSVRPYAVSVSALWI